MAATKTVWGIDIGQCALKAVKLQQDGDRFMVDACEIIEHSHILSQPDVDARGIVRASLDEFLQRHDVADSLVAVSVLGQSSFMRFVKLPPVERKKIPDIVRFEAEQQIPFPINEMTWRYQTFEDPDSPEIEAGIFAMKNADIHDMLSYFTPADLDVDIVQMAPLALYNFMRADHQYVDDGATLLCDVGADKTHLVISDGNRVWTRTVNIGGNNFTNALCKSFNLNFEKAEKLKRTASASKYARQIFQVMRPVFAQLVQEIQRSIGYYTSINRECRFKKLIGIGNGFLLPGMQKFLEQNLNMGVEQFKAFHNVITEDPNFQSRGLSFGVAFGLAVQGLSRGEIDCNLLPHDILRKRLWNKKTPWFAVAAAAIVVAAAMYTLRGFADYNTLQSDRSMRDLKAAEDVLSRLESWKQESRNIATNLEEQEKVIADNLKLRAYSITWPAINSHVAAALDKTVMDPNDARILQAFATGAVADPKAMAGSVRSDQAIAELISIIPVDPRPEADNSMRQELVSRLEAKQRDQLELMFLESLQSQYSSNLKTTTVTSTTGGHGGAYGPGAAGPGFGGPGGGGGTYGGGYGGNAYGQPQEGAPRGFVVMMQIRTPASQQRAAALAQKFKAALQEQIDSDPNLELADLIDVNYITAASTGVAGGGAVRPRAAAYGGAAGPGGYMEPGMGLGGVAARPAAGQEEKVLPTYIYEPQDMDVTIQITAKIAVKGDGLPKKETEKEPVSSR